MVKDKVAELLEKEIRGLGDSREAQLRAVIASQDPILDLSEVADFSETYNEFRVAPKLSVFDNAIHNFGSYSYRFTRQMAFNWLVRRALLVGVQKSVNELWRYISRKKIPAHQIMLIDSSGLNFSNQPIDLVSGIEVSTLAGAPVEYFRKQINDRSGIEKLNQIIFSKRIRTERRIIRSQSPTSNEETQSKLNFEVFDDFRLILALVSEKPNQAVATGVTLSDEVPGAQGFTFFQHSHRSPIKSSRPLVQKDFDEAKKLFGSFERLSKKQKYRFRIPLNRLNDYQTETNLVQSAIDLRTCLEALFLDGNKDGEFRFRLSLRAALLTEKSIERRRHVRASVRNAYDIGSAAVHTGRFDASGSGSKDDLSTAADTARKALIGMIRNPVSDWSEIELGLGLHTSR